MLNTIVDRKSVELIFTITLFVSAALLFGVEPMFAKMILPRLGGSAAVWSVAIAFFQTMLLLGYLYAHIITRYFNFITAAAVHFGFLAIAFLPLPIAVSPAFHEPPPGGEDLWLIGLFAASVGLPFFAVSATSPLMQAWFARTGSRTRKTLCPLWRLQPRVFRCAARLPFLIEPALTLRQQSHWWTMRIRRARGPDRGMRERRPSFGSRSRGAGGRATSTSSTGRPRATARPGRFSPCAVRADGRGDRPNRDGGGVGPVPLGRSARALSRDFRARFPDARDCRLPGPRQASAALTAASPFSWCDRGFPPCSRSCCISPRYSSPPWCATALYRRRPAASYLTGFYL